jgi:hypothetical protein
MSKAATTLDSLGGQPHDVPRLSTKLPNPGGLITLQEHCLPAGAWSVPPIRQLHDD